MVWTPLAWSHGLLPLLSQHVFERYYPWFLSKTALHSGLIDYISIFILSICSIITISLILSFFCQSRDVRLNFVLKPYSDCFWQPSFVLLTSTYPTCSCFVLPGSKIMMTLSLWKLFLTCECFQTETTLTDYPFLTVTVQTLDSFLTWIEVVIIHFGNVLLHLWLFLTVLWIIALSWLEYLFDLHHLHLLKSKLRSLQHRYPQVRRYCGHSVESKH